MTQTITEKILAKASGKKSVHPQEWHWIPVNTLMAHDAYIPLMMSQFYREFGNSARIPNPEKVVLIIDHFGFTQDFLAQANNEQIRFFAQHQGIKLYDRGQGISHILLAEEGYNRPGDIIVGTDSHTTTSGAFGTMAIGVGATDATFTMGTGEILLRVPETIRVNFQGELPPCITAKDLILQLLGDLTTYGANYCAIEFGGELIDKMSIDERMTLCNMAAESGAKNAIMVPNEVTFQYLQKSTSSPWEIFVADKNAGYLKSIEYDVSRMTPLVALPHSPDNVISINAVAGTLVDRAYIGSCTGGKLNDFIAAAQLLSGQKVTIETLAVPASNAIIEGMMSHEINGCSVYQTLLEAGVQISLEASCAACCGGLPDTFGRLHDPKTVISTTNRNFPGRMGHKQSQIYLASPYTVAASAIAGYLTNPQNFVQ